MFLGKFCNFILTLKDFSFIFYHLKALEIKQFCKFELTKSDILLFSLNKTDFFFFFELKNNWLLAIMTPKNWLSLTRRNPVKPAFVYIIYIHLWKTKLSEHKKVYRPFLQKISKFTDQFLTKRQPCLNNVSKYNRVAIVFEA